MLSVQSKCGELESSCKTYWQDFALANYQSCLPSPNCCQSGDGQCNVMQKCLLCDSIQPTTTHMPNGCPVALAQQCYTGHHNQVLCSSHYMLTKAFVECPSVKVYANH